MDGVENLTQKKHTHTRQIKASNDVFYSSVGQYKSAIDVLLSLNFQLESGVLLTIYPTENNWTKLQLGEGKKAKAN